MNNSKKFPKLSMQFILGFFSGIICVFLCFVLCIVAYGFQLLKSFGEPIPIVDASVIENKLAKELSVLCNTNIINVRVDKNTILQGTLFAVGNRNGIPQEDQVNFESNVINGNADLVYLNNQVSIVKKINGIELKDFKCTK